MTSDVGHPQMTLSRRGLLAAAVAAVAAKRVSSAVTDVGDPAQPLRILLRSGWQEISTADNSQTAGAIAMLEKHLPDAAVTLWPAHLTELDELALRRRFSKLKFVGGTIDRKTRKPADPELLAAFECCDVVLHNSAPFVISADALDAARELHKPFGVFGVTLGAIDERLNALLSNANFVYAGDTSSLELARKVKVESPVLGFVPDAAFAFDLRDDKVATAYLRANSLEPGKFLCCVPRLRYTPFKKQFSGAEVDNRTAVSEKFAEPDHAKMRQAIADYVGQTGGKVLVCPEMKYQLSIMDKLLIDPLPSAVKKHVVKKEEFWLANEASSVFAKAAMVLSYELHSVILALAAGTPAIHVRLPTEGSKSEVLRDIGLREWLMPIDDTTGEQLSAAVLAIVSHRDSAKKKIEPAMAAVTEKQKEALAMVANTAAKK